MWKMSAAGGEILEFWEPVWSTYLLIFWRKWKDPKKSQKTVWDPKIQKRGQRPSKAPKKPVFGSVGSHMATLPASGLKNCDLRVVAQG